MWKVVLLVLVIVVVAWVIGARRRSRLEGAHRGAAAAPPQPGGVEPVQMKMLACAHCGVHLPQADALMDASGRPYCSAAHRLSGPD